MNVVFFFLNFLIKQGKKSYLLNNFIKVLQFLKTKVKKRRRIARKCLKKVIS